MNIILILEQSLGCGFIILPVSDNLGGLIWHQRELYGSK